MTSLSPTRSQQPSIEGRSVRDIVENSPELVNEVWCRKIFRQILQSLELQYAMQMPHRAITPDTVVFHENGEPLLVPALIGEPAHTEGEDMVALAAIVHYAITHETVPTAPLRGRVPEGYSESLVTAVDRCLAPDPAQRPRSIEELRDILGIVSLGPPVGAQLAPARTVMAAMPRAPALDAQAVAAPGGADGLPSFVHAATAAGPGLGVGLSRWQRWALAAGGGALLAALALAMFAELRDSGSYDHIVLTLPQTGDHARDGRRSGKDGGNDALLAGVPARAQGPSMASSDAGTGASEGGAMAAGGQDASSKPAPAPAAREGVPPPGAPDAATAPRAALGAPLALPGSARQVQGAHAAANTVAAGGASYRLRIQPWGVVYVDGVDRGVSPPVKRLVLAPGRHTLRVANPAFPDRVLEVDTGEGDGQIAVDFNDQAR